MVLIKSKGMVKRAVPEERRARMRKDKSGFTLIELIVVVAIISVLSLILYPAVMRGIEKARQAECIGHLRQIGLALKMYSIDWNGALPYAKRHAYSDDPQSIVSHLSPYLESPCIFICASTEEVFKERFKLSYVYNVSGDLIDPMRQIGRPTVPGVMPHDVWALVDARSPGNPNPHFNFANALWLDGRVTQHKED